MRFEEVDHRGSALSPAQFCCSWCALGPKLFDNAVVAPHLRNRSCNVARVVRVEEKAGLPDNFGNCAACCRNDRRPTGDGLRGWKSKAFAESRHRDRECIGIERGQDRVRHEARKVNAILKPMLINAGMEILNV